MKISKKNILATITVTSMVLTAGALGAYADSTLKQITAYQNAALNVTVNGHSIDMSSEDGLMYPIVYSGHSYVSAKAVAEALGASVKWNSDSQTVEITSNNQTSGTAGIPNINKSKVDVSLWEAYANAFPIGAAVSPNTIVSKENILGKHFNSLTPENVMKFSEIHPEENTFLFERADQIVNFAVNHQMKVRGHTLVWYQQTPNWVFTETSRDVLLQRMEQHIRTVMQHYRGKVYAWDVVNEAVADGGPNLLRDNKWLQIIGEDYIQKAFEFARKADPDAQLFYNDYNVETPEKRQRVYKLVKDLKERGTPIDGIGIQGHWGLQGPSVKEIEDTLNLFASLNVKVQITELDLSFYNWNDKEIRYSEPTEEMLDRQAQRYKEIFKLLLKHRDLISGVTFWGVTDETSWLNNSPVKGRKNWPLLFNKAGEPKKAFWAVMSATQESR